MISILHHMNSILRLTALNLTGIFLLAVTLCVAFPFFLVVVSIGTASRERMRWGAVGIRGEESAPSEVSSVERIYSTPAT